MVDLMGQREQWPLRTLACLLKRARNVVKFLFRSYRTYRNEDNILIYQMGKVGSTSIAKALGERAIQIHNFYPTNEPFSRKPFYRSSLYKKPIHWTFYYLIRRGIRRRSKLKVITLVRDPISRNVSMYFQDLYYFLAYYFSEIRPNRDSREEDIDILIDCFRETFDHRYPLDWFDKEFKRFTGVDVYEYAFDSNAGCTKIERGGISLLIIQTERLSDCWHVVEEFCGRKLELRKDNRGERKWYGPLYSEFLDRHSLQAGELDEIYSSRYATFFFSEETRAELRRRWLSHK
jgi:hypothetical protein